MRGILVVLWPLVFGAGCAETPAHRSVEDILKSGEITVITRNNAHCYYIYRGQEMGFEYDLARSFADYLGVRLRVRIAESWGGMIPDLANGTGDFIAASMTITPERQEQVLFSDGYYEIQQHIIAHRNNQGLTGIQDLTGLTIHVRKGTSYQNRLSSLREEGIDIRIVLYDDMPTQDLISMVANNTIGVTIADSNIALLNRRYYPQIRVSAAISEKEYLGWAVHPEAVDLHQRINAFLNAIRDDGRFDEIYRRYYANVEFFDYLDLRAFHRSIKGRLPRYSETIQRSADKYRFDWRLIAAQIYQESHFKPTAKSHMGAYGLMQLTPTMARSLGVEDILNPVENINAGVAYLRDLYDHFDRVPQSDRLPFALAAYNIGLGHIWDARHLARERNLDPNRWSSLSETLPLLRYRKYNRNLKYGYARGSEPIRYVNQIMIYYDILKQQSIDYGTGAPSPPEGVDPNVG